MRRCRFDRRTPTPQPVSRSLAGPELSVALLREGCEAVILIGSTLSDDDLGALAGWVSTVVLARRCSVPGLGVVRGDDLAGIALAVHHLTDLGHRRIAHIDDAHAPGSADRRAGFLATAERLGVDAQVRIGGLTEDDGARAVDELFRHTDDQNAPTGVIAFNDRSATGVLDTLRAGPLCCADRGDRDSRLWTPSGA